MSSVIVLPRSFGTTLTQVSKTAANQTIAAAVFTIINMNTVISDTGNNWDASQGHYIVPSTGLYQITGSLRSTDGQPSGTQFGVGVHTSSSDGYWFLWHSVQNTINVGKRTTYPYIRTDVFTAGQRLRMFTFSDQGYAADTAVLNIFRVA